MQNLELNTLSKNDLLDIEQICDEYERDLRSNTSQSLLDAQAYVQRAIPSIRPLVVAELDGIRAEWNTVTATQRMSDATHGTSSSSQNSEEPSQSFLRSNLGRRFQLLELLGKGSSGSVWKAYDKNLGRLVAIKIPHSGAVSNQDFFIREARAASRLNHPNIVMVLEVGHDDENCFLLSELVEGCSLADRLAERQFSIPESVDLLVAIASAIEYAHSMGIVHRDLKPHNVLIGNDKTVKLTDFGLAKEWTDDEATVTRTGSIVGTPAYMSPEQAEGGMSKTRPTSDIYSLGILFYQLLTGEVPFRGSPQMVLFQILHSDPPSPRRTNRNVPDELNTLCMKCIEKNPLDRFQTAKEFLDELIRYRDGRPILSKPVNALVSAKKWALRNRRVAGWIACTCLLLVVSTLVASSALIVIVRSWQNEQELRMEIKISSETANRETQSAGQIVQFLESVLHSSDPINALLMGAGSTNISPPIPRAKLDEMCDRLHNDLACQPIVQARLLDGIANVYRASGDFSRAESLLNEASIKRNYGERNGFEGQHSLHDALINKFYRGWLEHDKTRYGEAEKIYREILSVSLNNENQLFLADVQFQLGRLLIDSARATESLPFMEESLRIRTSLLPDDASSVKAAKIGILFSKRGKVTLMEMLEVAALVVDQNGLVGEIGLDYAGCAVNRQCKNYPQASKSYASMIEKLLRFLPKNHPVTLFALGDYAGFLMESGDYRTAATIAKDFIAIGDAICPGHKKLVGAKLDLAFELMRATDFSKASALYEEVLAHQLSIGVFPEEAHYGLTWCLLAQHRNEQALVHAKSLWGHREGKTASQVAWCAYTYARALEKCGNEIDAKRMDERALAEAVIELHFPTDAIGLERLAIIHDHNGDLAKAEKLLRDALGVERSNRPAIHPRLADQLSNLALNQLKQNRPGEVHSLLSESLAIREKTLPIDDARIVNTRSALQSLSIQ